MTIRIHNVLTRRKEPFVPVEEGRLKIYVCGVTVYGRCHLGHLRCYLSFDAILRYFRYRGFDVRYVRNFTDIDDKIIARAREINAGPDGAWRGEAAYAGYDAGQWAERLAEDERIRARATGRERHLAEAVADHFIEVFRDEDFAPFDLLPPAVEPRVSEKIPEVVALIERIIDRGFAYACDGDVYFDVPSYHAATGAYGRLSGRDFNQMLEGARVSPTERKRQGADFALWKRSAPDEPAWPSPWSAGRPGWHIECSAMSLDALGQPFDIHGGGKDLIFPHHENEIAQAEAATGGSYCGTWMHNGFVTVDGVKMSKSLGNFISIREALGLAVPEVWRLLVLGTHYAHPIDFSRTRERAGAEGEGCQMVRGTIEVACARLEYFYETLRRARRAAEGQERAAGGPILDDPRAAGIAERFTLAMDDDFNTARALAGIGESMKYLNELCDLRPKQISKLAGGRDAWLATLARVSGDLREVCGVLGLCGREPDEALVELRDFAVRCRGLDRAAIETGLAERDAARQAKDWARSDALRDELLGIG
ncbi:MAG TPA: cysteine--tRNA ligase, partial [Polyangia bacterium]|nr:cysteine--tRNA ligase [Polyangia bacterium]